MNKFLENKNIKMLSFLMTAVLFMAGCSDYLDLQPTDKVTPDNVFGSEAGIEAFLANLYRNMPIEDFNYNPISLFGPCFNFNSNNAALFENTMTDDGTNSQISWLLLYNDWWTEGYSFNKDVNLFFSYIPTIKSISDEAKTLLYGEAYFLRAFTYFTLARRYGGVPIITSIAELTDTLALYPPRRTEKETWDFALANCDTAAMFLGDDIGNGRRVNKWTALALKSRIALHAASLAKYWNKAPFSGAAVDAKLVGGMTQEDALRYYDQCISASEQIMNSGKYSLYKPNPANPEEAAENYRLLFEFPNNALEEAILVKGFGRVGYGHMLDNWANPAQTAGAWPYPGRFNPTLELIDTYESYSNPGHSSPIVTTEDGITDDYRGYDPSRKYLIFDDPTEIFTDKDARMHATIILPGSMWKNTKIVVQGGYIKPDGTPVIEADESIEVDGKTYYTYGAASAALYSGFNTISFTMTRTGFLQKKCLSTTYVPLSAWNMCTTDWIAFRYAEVLLNYAEAVVESGHGDEAKAEKAINDLRKRAAHTVDIPLTLENVLRERRVELIFENGRLWDLGRRRELHLKWQRYKDLALVPVLDLRTMKYIFVRKYATGSVDDTFYEKNYYLGIPATGTNKLVNNPQY